MGTVVRILGCVAAAVPASSELAVPFHSDRRIVAGLHTARQTPATEHADSEGAAEQRDAADEAQGGTRTAS